MNINCFVSEKLYRFERHYQKENLGKSKYLMIKRDCGSSPLGLFAYFITNVAWIEYALRKNYIPVIDMQNFQNVYHKEGEVGKVNTYDYFFKQPAGIGVEEALASGKARYVWKDIPDFHPNESLDFFLTQEIVDYYREIVKKYVVFQDDVKERLEKVRKEILGEEGEKRILGVLARGTDYTSLKPYFHPVQPALEELIDKIDSYKEKYHCQKVYVATEDENILQQLSRKYGEDLLYYNQKRVQATDTFLNYNKEFVGVEPKKNGLDYLTSIYLLSKCNGLIAGRTSGTVGTMLLADNYEFFHIFSKGRYGVEEEILSSRVL